MSFVKCVKCAICSNQQSILDANFPEDVFDLITKYKMSDQLFWVCRFCKNDCCQKPISSVSTLLHKNINNEERLTSLNGHQNDQSDCSNGTLNSYDDKIDNISPLSPENELLCGSAKEDKYGLKYVHEILNLIKINHEEESASKKIVQSVLTSLLTQLKKNEEFACMFNRLGYKGSSYNDLRITSANEYDIDLVLKIPKNVKIIPVFDKHCYSFGKLKLEIITNDSTSLPLKFLKNMSCPSGAYLLPQSISSWLQSQIDIVLNQGFTPPDGVSKIKSVKSGPARTIIVETKLDYNISIDIVPVIEFEYSVLCDTPIFSKLEKTNDKNKDKWFMVPKECRGEINAPYSDIVYFWRTDYPYAEKCILSGKECAKSVIKILKIFRDKKDWKGLASYYLNTVVMLEIIKNPNSDFWKNGNLFQRLMDAFKQLSSYLRDHHLPHFLTKQNLLYKFNEAHCNNWHNHLNKIIPLLESNPTHLIQLLKGEEARPLHTSVPSSQEAHPLHTSVPSAQEARPLLDIYGNFQTDPY